MIAFVLAAVVGLACKAEDAHYRLRHAPEITADFRVVDSGRDWPAHLALRIHSARTGKSYWFLPWNGGTNDLQNLASTADVDAKAWKPPWPDGGPRPIGDFDYVAMDARYDVIDAIPMQGKLAPAHFLIPSLGDALWHQQDGVRDSAPKQFFDLVSCGSRR